MKQLMIDVFELKKKGYYKQAIEIFYKIMAKENDNLEILSELGDLYFLLKNYNRALHYINKALEINENHVNSLVILRKIQIEQKDYDNALKNANKIYILTENQNDLYELIKLLNIKGKYDQATGFKDFIKSDNVRLEIVKAYYKQNKYDEAIELLTQNNGLEESVEYLNILCKIYFKTNKLCEAKEVLKKLENKETNDTTILNYQGLSKLEDLKLDEAADYFMQALKIEPQNDVYNFNLGQSYFLKGWLEEAKKYFLKAICLNPTNQNYQYSLAYALYREEDYKNALLHLDNDLLDSKVLKSLIKYKMGDLATAKSELEKIFKDNQNNEIVVYALAQIYSELELYKKSLEFIKKALELKPKSFDYKSFMIDMLLKVKETDAAKPLIDELVMAYPNYYYAKTILAKYQYEMNDFDSLFDTAQALIEMDLNHYEGYYYNALALIEKNDINFAIENMKKAITLDVNNASLYVKMAEIYQRLGQYEDAFEYVKEASDIDKSAKNHELYMELANILRKNKSNLK